MLRALGNGQRLAGPPPPHLGGESGQLLVQHGPRARGGEAHRLEDAAGADRQLFELVRDERDEQRSRAEQEQRGPVDEPGKGRLALLQQHGGGEDRGEPQHSERDVHHSSFSARSASATVVSDGSISSAFFQASRARAAFPSFW